MGHELLLEILSHKRPHNSKYEQDFVATYIVAPLKAKGLEPMLIGPMENVVVGVGDPDKNTKVLFSCHTDTVHSAGGVQEVIFDANLGTAFKTDKDSLGADDGTGVWIMLEMIERDIPGTYVFHRGEECGCVGSGWMEKNQAKWLKKFDYAIAFDRKDEDDIITHQRARRCCSDEFATALGDAINVFSPKALRYKPSSHGVYTDTANYDGLISECTNISVGYQGAHSNGEIQDVNFAVLLLEALCLVDWEKLPVKREAKREEYTHQWTRPTSHVTRGHSYGYSSSPYNRSSGTYTSTYEREGELRTYFNMADTQDAVLNAMVDIHKSPPFTMQEILNHDLSTLDIYLMGLLRVNPERAMMVMRLGLIYYQYYARTLQLTPGDRVFDSGQLAMPPAVSKLLRENFDRTWSGILVKREAAQPQLPIPYNSNRMPNVAPDVSDIKAARENRKAAKKAAKASKKGGRAGNAGRFPDEGAHQGTKPSSDPMRGAASMSPMIVPLLQGMPAPTQDAAAATPTQVDFDLDEAQRLDPWEIPGVQYPFY